MSDMNFKGFKDLIKLSEQLERDNKKLQSSNKKLAYENQKLKKNLEAAELRAINKNELENLRLENDRLLVKVNQLRRMEDKFIEVQRIIMATRKKNVDRYED